MIELPPGTVNDLVGPVEPITAPGFTWSSRDVLWIVFGIGASFLIGILLIGGIAALTGNRALLDRQPALLLSLLAGGMEAGALFSGVYFFGLRRRQISWSLLFGPPLNRHWAWITAASAFGATIASGVIAAFVTMLRGSSANDAMLTFLAPGGFSWISFLAILLTAGVIVPIAEEVFFRGVLFHWLRQGWNFWPAALVSGVIFGVLHGEISLAIAAFFMGLVMAFLYEKSRSLWAAIVVHIVNNSIKIILLYLILAQ